HVRGGDEQLVQHRPALELNAVLFHTFNYPGDGGDHEWPNSRSARPEYPAPARWILVTQQTCDPNAGEPRRREGRIEPQRSQRTQRAERTAHRVDPRSPLGHWSLVLCLALGLGHL